MAAGGGHNSSAQAACAAGTCFEGRHVPDRSGARWAQIRSTGPSVACAPGAPGACLPLRSGSRSARDPGRRTSQNGPAPLRQASTRPHGAGRTARPPWDDSRTRALGADGLHTRLLRARVATRPRHHWQGAERQLRNGAASTWHSPAQRPPLAFVAAARGMCPRRGPGTPAPWGWRGLLRLSAPSSLTWSSDDAKRAGTAFLLRVGACHTTTNRRSCLD